MKLQAETSAVINCLARAHCPEMDGLSDWLNVCTEIKENLQAVDDNTPERYPNRMIADLSDMLEDTSAVAVDVGQHMVWSYQSFKNRKVRSFFSQADTVLWDMDFRRRSVHIMRQENQPHVSAETVHFR